VAELSEDGGYDSVDADADDDDDDLPSVIDLGLFKAFKAGD
jgi:hypothetical protein